MRSICVVGFAPETRELVSELPETVELWGMNVNHKFMTRWDRWFQLHPPVWGGRPFYGRSIEHYEFLKSCDVPLFMGHPNGEFPTAVLYPTDDVVKNLGRNYLTSTVAKAVAMAIYEEVDEIKIYGVKMASNTEYVEQRPCVEWLIGLAEGRGIKVDLPPDTPVMQGAEYPDGYGTHPRIVAQSRLDEKRATYYKYWQYIHQNVGALHLLGLLEEGKDPDELKRHYLGEGQELYAHLNTLRGAIGSEKFHLAHAGGFDRNASTMPHIRVPKGYYSPQLTRDLEDMNVG